MKAKTRKLVVDGLDYLVRVHREPRGSGWGECFTAFRQGSKASPLRVHFVSGFGSPCDHEAGGTIVVGEVAYNLNLPRHAAALVRHALAQGWLPERAHSPFEVSDGVAWLALLEPTEPS
jgi:hypothetical protein